jgi:hypothetical protein
MTRQASLPCLRWLGAVALAAAALAAGCGGSVGVGGTGSYAAAPIAGFGSVIVGGIKFDDSAAAVVDDDGATSSREALRLGMTIEVMGGEIGGTEAAPTATASRIRMVSEIVGPASSVDAAGGTLKVFDQAVKVDAATVFDASLPDGLASVADGAALEVFGQYDAAALQFVAARIALRAGTIATYKVRGPVQDLNAAARTFRIGAAQFGYDGAQPLLAEGAYVRVQADTVPVAGRWLARSISEGVRRLPELDRIKLHGAITRYVSDAEFDVNGQPVDARGASFNGRPGDLALGRAVVVDGSATDGVLVAGKVRLDDRGSQGMFTLQGAIESVAAADQTFVLRGTTIFHGANGLQFEGGGAADIAAGRAVTVRAVATGNSAALTARRITFN